MAQLSVTEKRIGRSEAWAAAHSNSSMAGIYLTGTQSGIRLYNNSVSLNGTYTAYSTTSTIITAALAVESGSTVLDVRNNIFANTFAFTGTLGLTALTTTGGSASQTFSNLAPGAYTVAETDPTPGYDFTSLVCVETPASLTMQMLDLRAVCAAAAARGIPVACDATWGTPVFFRPHELGVSLSVHAATKFIGGHSDLMLGLITGNEAAMAPVRRYCDQHGAHAAPDACWMALRGLRTLAVRMARHQETALTVARWLQAQPQVVRVHFPALASDPGHALWRAQFSGAGGPFTIELLPCTEPQFERFIDSLRLFALGTSWGGFESLVMPAIPHAMRGLAVQPDSGRLVRLHVGLEDAQDLCGDLAQALKMLTGE